MIKLKTHNFCQNRGEQGRVKDRRAVSEIVLRENPLEALDGIKDFSYCSQYFGFTKPLRPLSWRRAGYLLI